MTSKNSENQGVLYISQRALLEKGQGFTPMQR